MLKVLLVPEGGLYLAFRLPRLIRSAGAEVEVWCLRGDPVGHSRYVRAAHRESTVDALVERLAQFLRAPERAWQAVIVAHEGVVRRLLAGGDADLLNHWQPGARDLQVRQFLLGKFGLAAVYANRQLMVPPSRICGTVAELAEFGGAVGWPIISKPPDRSGGVGVVKWHAAHELAAYQAPLALPTLAQKYIWGRRGVVDLLCAAGRPLAWLASYSSQRAGGEFGPSTARLFCAMPALRPLVEDVARFTRFEGFCGFDWIEEEATGRHFLIEFHPRPPSGFRFARYCGVDFPAAMAAWLNQETAAFPTQVQRPGVSVAAHYFSCDLLRCLRQRDGGGLKPWLPGSGACHDVYLDDWPWWTRWMAQRCWQLFSNRFSGAKGRGPGKCPPRPRGARRARPAGGPRRRADAAGQCRGGRYGGVQTGGRAACSVSGRQPVPTA